MSQNVLEVEHLKTYFPILGGLFQRTIGHVRAVDDISLTIQKGETLGLVGESGCGKSTLGRSIIRLVEPSSGKVLLNGTNLLTTNGQELRNKRKDVQMIFQDPYESLNSRHTIGSILAEPFVIHNLLSPKERDDAVVELLRRVGLPENARLKYPHEFSGGQRQRIGIARAIALRPNLVICDEPISALDVSIQAQIMNLLIDIQNEMGMAYLFIAHDLAAVRHISDRIAVMYLGVIVEEGPSESISSNPQHPYTQALLSAVPVADPQFKKRERIVLKGDVPSPSNPPSGCRFHTRCPYVQDRCRVESPELKSRNEKIANSKVACHFPLK
ncbi:MAG: dipeptide ABC transporter ATP-binding protein [Proteobacteria bacterium]|nr:dipeptide ABC transporter ATP-binding protein [Pseudomonadota bacterium]